MTSVNNSDLNSDGKNSENNNIEHAEMMRNMAKRINCINDKKHMISIVNIIRTMNPSIPITENDNGIFIKFNMLSQETFAKLENYMHKNLGHCKLRKNC